MFTFYSLIVDKIKDLCLEIEIKTLNLCAMFVFKKKTLLVQTSIDFNAKFKSERETFFMKPLSNFIKLVGKLLEIN